MRYDFQAGNILLTNWAETKNDNVVGVDKERRRKKVTMKRVDNEKYIFLSLLLNTGIYSCNFFRERVLLYICGEQMKREMENKYHLYLFFPFTQ